MSRMAHSHFSFMNQAHYAWHMFQSRLHSPKYIIWDISSCSHKYYADTCMETLLSLYDQFIFNHLTISEYICKCKQYPLSFVTTSIRCIGQYKNKIPKNVFAEHSVPQNAIPQNGTPSNESATFISAEWNQETITPQHGVSHNGSPWSSVRSILLVQKRNSPHGIHKLDFCNMDFWENSFWEFEFCNMEHCIKTAKCNSTK